MFYCGVGEPAGWTSLLQKKNLPNQMVTVTVITVPMMCINYLGSYW